MKDGDYFILSNMINPTATIILITTFAYINEKKEFSGFKYKMLLELNDRELKNEIEYRKAIETELEKEVLFDSLTDIYNRRASEKILSNKMTQFLIENRTFAIIYIDLDDLKIINDTYGHDYGDEYLVTFTKSMKRHFSKGVCMFRMGGDEFLIFLEDKGMYETDVLVKSFAGVCFEKTLNLVMEFQYQKKAKLMILRV